MSTLTKDDFVKELKVRSAIIGDMDDDDVDVFVDIALREYSDYFPKLEWSVENAVVDGVELYDFPTGAVRIVSVRTSEGRNKVRFQIEDQGGGDGNQIRLGSVILSSQEALMEQGYYIDPTNGSGVAVLTTTSLFTTLGYTAYDVEFAKLQTVETISDDGLEKVALYAEHLAYNKKASQSALEAGSESGESAESITEQDATGASTTVKYTTKTTASKTYEDMAEKKLAEFKKSAIRPYGTRS